MESAILAGLFTLVGIGVTLFVQGVTKQQERTDKFRLAALDKRLAAHQAAYALWWKLRDNLGDEEACNQIAIQCQDWWVANNLYLTAKSREQFYWSCQKASLASQNDDRKTRIEARKYILNAGKIIQEGVHLPDVSS